MKKLIKVSAVILSTQMLLGMASQAHAQAIDPIVEARLVKICKVIQSGNKLSLRRTLKRARLTEKTLVEGLKCNGMDPITFAVTVGADKSAHYLASKARVPLVQVASSKN